MARKSTTGKCAPYSPADLALLGLHIIDTVERTGSTPPVIWAEVEYHGVIARANNGFRKFTLSDLRPEHQAKVVEAARKAAEARRMAREAQPKKSYRAKGWKAQLRQLFKTSKGREVLKDSGLSVTKRTQDRWLKGAQSPNRANREAIARAYETMRMENVHAASKRAEEHARNVGKVFDQVVAEAYGENGVRFRNIDRNR